MIKIGNKEFSIIEIEKIFKLQFEDYTHPNIGECKISLFPLKTLILCGEKEDVNSFVIINNELFISDFGESSHKIVDIDDQQFYLICPENGLKFGFEIIDPNDKKLIDIIYCKNEEISKIIFDNLVHKGYAVCKSSQYLPEIGMKIRLDILK